MEASGIMPVIQIERTRYEVQVVLTGKDLVYAKKRYGYVKVRRAGMASGPINEADIIIIVKKL